MNDIWMEGGHMLAKIVAGIAFIITVIVERIVFHAMDRWEEKNNRMAKAEQMGHIVTAVRDDATVRFKTVTCGENEEYYEWACVYRYEVNGKRYGKTITNMRSHPSETMVLYYTNNPAKAFIPLGSETGGKTIRFLLSFLLPLVVCGFVYGVLS